MNDADKAVEVRLGKDQETFWLNLQQLAELFERGKSVISRHLGNIYKEGELVREATVAKNATVQQEGARQVRRSIDRYNLDAIISVGYRVSSGQATRFRQWATPHPARAPHSGLDPEPAALRGKRPRAGSRTDVSAR